ncbi:hypothetical protein ACFLW4_01590 [Chloroflexota bacterium]
MKTYILYSETKNSDGKFTVLGLEQAESPNEAFEKLKAESYWSELRALISDPVIRVREAGELNYVYLGATGVATGA